jgi:ABC-type Fe3+ transport system permease subunit
MRLSVPNPLSRSLRRFAEDPASIGNAVRLVIGVTIGTVLAGSAVIWIFDRRDFPDDPTGRGGRR